MFQPRRTSRKSFVARYRGEEDNSAQRIMRIKEKSDMYRHKVEIPQPTTVAYAADIADMRDRSILTADTVDSAMYSSDLLHQMDHISDTDSELDRTVDGDNLAVQESILVHDSGADEIEMDLSMSRFYDDIMGIKSLRLSSWVEDKPFDEETLRQLSEKGEEDGIEAVFAGGTTVVREDIIPPIPASYDELVGLEENRMTRDISNRGDDDVKAKGSRKANRAKKSCIGWKHGFAICILFVILLVGAVLVGLSASRGKVARQTNQAVASPSDESHENDSGNTDAEAAPSESPAGSIVEPPTGDNDTAPKPSSSPTVFSPAEPVNEPQDPKPTDLPAPNKDTPNNDTTSPSPAPLADPTDIPMGSPTDSSTKQPSSGATMSPVTDPAPKPTTLPTSEPDALPTPAPVSPTPVPTQTNPPTVSPVTSSPSPSPTAVCEDKISVSEECFSSAVNSITVDFMNCNPRGTDWVVVDADGADFTNPRWIQSNPWQLTWSCDTLGCDGSETSFRFGYPTNDSGLSALQLRAYMVRQTEDGGPYEIIAVSRSFVLTYPCG